MAKIGDILLQPESGWKRYDDRFPMINFVGSWTQGTTTGYYDNTHNDSTSTDSYYEFCFKGTSIRIIDALASNRSENVSVIIDGETETYSAKDSTTTRCVLVYEKTGLKDEVHKVVVKNNTTGYMTLDAIDINDGGEIYRHDYLETSWEEPIKKYGIAWFGFDEPSGNVLDKLGGDYVGTTYANATRVDGWNNNGYAMNFNRTSTSYVSFNNKVIPTGDVTVRMKIYFTAQPSSENQEILSCSYATATDAGIRVWLDTSGKLIFTWTHKSDGNYSFILSDTPEYQKWYDYMLSWDTASGTVKLYRDEELINQTTSISNNSKTPTYNLRIGQQPNSQQNRYFNGMIDDLQIFNKALEPSDLPKKRVVFKSLNGKYITVIDGKLRELPNTNETTMVNYGKAIKEIDYATDRTLFDFSTQYTTYEKIDSNGGSITTQISPTSLNDLLGASSQLVYYTDTNASQIMIDTDVEPFSVYDYISETPEVLVYTEDTEDIVVSTTHDKFDMYDVFEDNIEIISYADDTSVLNANLILEANYSPIDELEGDFEVITWTDEETTERICEFSAIPKPQFLKLENPKQIFGSLKNMFVNNISETYRDEVRVLFCGKDTSQWKVWDKKQGNFILVDASTEQAVLKNGMKTNDVIKITESEWQKWKDGFINIGIFLKDNPRDTITSIVETISYADTLPRDTTTIADTSFYILNTTAKIDLALNGSLLTGVLADDDLTRVQYRVLLNGNYYYPADGSFTKLGEAPQNIELAFSSSDIKMNEWNTVKVEFQDFFGTTDYWSNQFMGTYTGLMFKDVYGQYYSNEIGEVLQYLDFGIIIAGQTTLEHEIILKNQYGYDIKNVHLFANTGMLPKGMSLEFSQTQSPFVAQPELKLSSGLKNGEEMSFFVRCKTELGVTPNANGTLDIIVRADKA